MSKRRTFWIGLTVGLVAGGLAVRLWLWHEGEAQREHSEYQSWRFTQKQVTLPREELEEMLAESEHRAGLAEEEARAALGDVERLQAEVARLKGTPTTRPAP